MSPRWDRLGATLTGLGLRLDKAIPRSPDHLLLTLRRADGSTMAGQWFADHAHAETVGRQTRLAVPQAAVRVRDGVVTQPDGADRVLVGLHRSVGEANAVLVAHRPEQRAVIRHSMPGTPVAYTKMVRPKKLARTVAGAQLAVAGVDTAPVLHIDEHGGSLTFGRLPGRSLFDLIADPAVDIARIVTAGRAVGRAMSELHRGAPADPLPCHDATAEWEVVRRWRGFATAYGLLEDWSAPMDRLQRRAGEWLTGADRVSALVHRDLHDKQLLLDGDRVGLLDFDLAAAGEPALDVANLLVHLELRALQGRCTPARAGACVDAVLEGYEARSTEFARRLAAYQITARIRLACVYAFRPDHAHAGRALLAALVDSSVQSPTSTPALLRLVSR